ncbi:hypothetical protein ABE504_06295 [Paenibacillus oryzisoli]|uniref:hypothetical protein n=1 Tax=Paenibacillus oryzisoli TaxID=1850517 RepID=UPI003D2C6835
MKINIPFESLVYPDDKNTKAVVVSNEDFSTFNSDLLNLGNLNTGGKRVEGISAVFDLDGFTNFCNQMEPHLVVPRFLKEFLSWILKKIAQTHLIVKRENTFEGKKALYSRLPIFCKFLGDGLLMIWDTDDMSEIEMGNVVCILKDVAESYANDFLPFINKKFVNVPEKLRCGIARGSIVQLGDGNDYVGPSINLASRLQKVPPSFTFAFSARGFDKDFFAEYEFKKYQMIKIEVRGIKGNEELVYVLKSEINTLSPKMKAQIQIL